MKVNYPLNHYWYDTNLLPHTVFNYVMSRDFIVKKSVQWGTNSVSLQNWRNLYGIVSYQNFFCIYITICISSACGSQVHVWVICMSQWHLDCSVSQVGQQVWAMPLSTVDLTLILAWEFMWLHYQDNFIYKNSLLLHIVRIVKI